VGMVLCTFSTIAESVTNNWIKFTMLTSAAGVGTPGFKYQVFVIPMDNDIVSPLTLIKNGRLNLSAASKEISDLRKDLDDLRKLLLPPAVKPKRPETENVNLPFVLNPDETAYVVEDDLAEQLVRKNSNVVMQKLITDLQKKLATSQLQPKSQDSPVVITQDQDDSSSSLPVIQPKLLRTKLSTGFFSRD